MKRSGGIEMRFALLAGLVILLSGCSGVFGPDKEGWRSSQKEAFIKILDQDRYMSLCDSRDLYQKVKESKNSRLMSKLLIAYANNLANGCIDYKAFEASQRAKREKKIETDYAVYRQKVDQKEIKRKLLAGESIESILQPYIPKNPQFGKLTEKYRKLQKDGNVSQRILKKVRLNIERAKIMKPDLGTHYALINIPEFKVRIVENNQTAMKFNVIVGKRDMQTPVFSQRMRYVEINPQWNVPDSIMRKSYIPKIMKNPGWVAAKGMELHKDSYDLRSSKVNPASVDWSKFPKDGKGYIPYKLVQIPSKKNGLGRVKFIFPNKHAVYMHDTQAKSLFKRKVRCYSHGCIRLDKPVALLELVTKHYSNKDMNTVEKWYDSLKTEHLILKKPLMVHTAYFTAYVDENGKLQLFDDVYGYDKSQKLRG
jgi:murein L,D-transpeptidase YcbB/YkuD